MAIGAIIGRKRLKIITRPVAMSQAAAVGAGLGIVRKTVDYPQAVECRAIVGGCR